MPASSASLRAAPDLRALLSSPVHAHAAHVLDFDPDALVRTAARARTTKVGRWSVVTKIATGGMGDVFLGACESPAGFRRLVAIKRLRDELACDPLVRGMFMDEARLAARLRHPNLVAAIELADDGICPYYAMEWLDGRTLAEIIAAAAQCGVWPDPRFFVHVIARALAGLHHAHELKDADGSPLGVVHRDVSPHNILVTFHGDVRLIDFGVADFAAPLQSRSRARQSIFAGKRGYVAPEHVEGKRIDRRADVFAMGVVTWEVLARRMIGKPSRVQRSGRRAYAPVSAFARGVDARLDRIVARALAVEPSERYSSALAMQMALEGWLAKTQQHVTPREIGTLVSAYFEEEKRDLDALVRADAIAAKDEPPPSSNAFWGSLPSVKAPHSRSRPVVVPSAPEPPREQPRDTTRDLAQEAARARATESPADASTHLHASAKPKDAKRTKKKISPMSLPVNVLRARSLVAPAETPDYVRSLLEHATRTARMGVVLVTVASTLAAICLVAIAMTACFR